MPETSAKRLLRNPLVHFLAAGALIYMAAKAFGVDSAGRYRLQVSEGHVASMMHAFEQTWLRPPTPAEVDALVEDYVREEILYREAVAAGLPEHDQVIRLRLRQTMEQLVADLADAMEPTDAELSAFLDRHRERFLPEPAVSFDQVYLSPATLRADPDAAETLLAQLRGGGSEAEPAATGDRSSLPSSMDSASLREVGRVFGADFAGRLPGLEPGHWSGPVASGFGTHLIRLRGISAPELPELEAIRGDVENAWRASRKTELDEAYYSELRSRYVVSIESR